MQPVLYTLVLILYVTAPTANNPYPAMQSSQRLGDGYTQDQCIAAALTENQQKNNLKEIAYCIPTDSLAEYKLP